MADDHTLSAPALPAPTGPPQPVLAPELETPMRPWEQLAVPGAFDAVQSARRVERYGAPVAPVWRAVIASVLVAAAMVAGARSVLAFWDRRSVLVDADGGLESVNGPLMIAADDRAANAAVLWLALTALAGVAVIVWTFRAYRTVAAWRPIELRLRWAVLGWIVPVANLIVPVRVLTEIVDGSSRGGHGRRIPLLWWVLWTLPMIGTFGIRMVDVETVEGFIVQDTVSAVSMGCITLAGVFLLVIIARSTDDQRRRLAEQQLSHPCRPDAVTPQEH